MLQCPQEIILHICQYLGKEYLNQYNLDDIEDDINDGKDINLIVYENLKQLFIENKGDDYYPVRNLYATCKAFEWMNKLEYIYISEGEFHYNINTCDINGLYHGMCYNGGHNLMGYIYYDHGHMVKQNELYTDSYYFYREVEGIVYKEHENCDRWSNTCDKECHNCQQLDKIQAQVFENDPDLEKIFKNNYDDGKIIIREVSPFRKPLTFDIV